MRNSQNSGRSAIAAALSYPCAGPGSVVAVRQGLVYVGSAPCMSVLCGLGGEARVSVGGVEVFV